MLAVLAHGEDTFRLLDAAGREVGWIQPKTIGFGGFLSEDSACAAALDGARTLVRCLKREFGVAHLELSEQPRTRTVRDGDAEWVADGKVRLARLLRVGDRESGAFAIEFRLPPYANEAVAINLAQVVYGVLSPGLTGPSVGPIASAANEVAR